MASSIWSAAKAGSRPTAPLGHAEIPAIVVEATEEDGLVMSLVENIARRQHRAIDLLHDIEGMKRRGYSEGEIARKTDLTVEYVRGVIQLLETGRTSPPCALSSRARSRSASPSRSRHPRTERSRVPSSRPTRRVSSRARSSRSRSS